ncbi:thiamine pyrophosphate-binding protein [Deinococcus roseus]|uniref:Benzoylformate decarboxylase n=1 Tax=Deinococcus roseus TaxID=392414 RepID=A0ABQ2DCC4_9DEIO|nr:thiamine pyrophosphate-binding protein [Deinococcus roseus]GGJ52175.1 benzoylformate decarboxylase [Deinococcus roseus]
MPLPSVKTGRHAIIEQFMLDGMPYMFGNPGTVEQGFLDALEDYPDFHYILTLQETIAVAMADGYARALNHPALVQLHSSVGVGNGIGMIYQAMRGHAPLVVIAGEAGTQYDPMDAQMAVDLVAMAKPVTKYATRVIDPQSLLRVLRRAIKIAATPPCGPVFISLPMDVLDAPITEEVRPTTKIHSRVTPPIEQLQEAANLLAAAQNPLILMGDGISFSGAQGELAAVAEAVGAPVWGVNSSEVNLPASHPLNAGLTGHMFGETSQKIVKDADVILVSGTYLFPEVFPSLGSPFKPDAKLIHIDLNVYEIAKNFDVDLALMGDPKSALAILAGLLNVQMSDEQKNSAHQRTEKYGQQKRQQEEQARSRDLDQKTQTQKNHTALHMAAFTEILADLVPEDTIIFDEALTNSPALNRYLPANKPGHFFQTRGGSLGVGIPGALGIKLAKPDSTVIAFTGDGGSMYTIQALWTAAHHNINAKFVVCNNGAYLLLKRNIDQYWKEQGIEAHGYPKSFDLLEPVIDFVKVSEGLHVPAMRVETLEQIRPAIIQMLRHQGPFLIDLVLSAES